MKKILSAILLLTLILVACSNNSEEKENEEKEIEEKENEEKENENEEEEDRVNPIATIIFKDLGEMTFELRLDQAPQSVYNFTELANAGFYDGLSMHRLVKDFVVQGGDPDGNGKGGPGYSIKGEFYANGVQNDTGHELGSLAFARSQMPDSAGSQFYIVLSDYDSRNRKHMDNDYAAFGTMLSGHELLDIINNEYVSNDPMGTPAKDLIIESVTVDTKGATLEAPTKLK